MNEYLNIGNSPRKICVVTGTRAEYGLLRLLLHGIQNDPDLVLQLVVTGTHLSSEFGSTVSEIEQDGFKVDGKVEMLLSSDSSVGVSKSIGLGIIGFADCFESLKPDLLVLLGDRFEIFAAATVASVRNIPIAHLHGGESTEGAFDEAFRHSITKMSYLHFVAASQYRDRVIQLGEDPERVFLVGGLGVDAINRLDLLDRRELETILNFNFGKRNLLITFHPATLEPNSSQTQMRNLLQALSELKDTKLIFTYPNADAEGKIIINLIEDFVSNNSANAIAFKSLGQLKYLSCIAQVDGVVGNSSSGLAEVPSFKKATINIGDRQKGRLSAKSVINCNPTYEEISSALKMIYTSEFQEKKSHAVNPYGNGDASNKILEIIKSYQIPSRLKKSFHDAH